MKLIKIKLFLTTNKAMLQENHDAIDECRLFFNFMLPSEKIETRRISFEILCVSDRLV